MPTPSFDTYFRFYNERRPHSSLGNATPGETYRAISRSPSTNDPALVIRTLRS